MKLTYGAMRAAALGSLLLGSLLAPPAAAQVKSAHVGSGNLPPCQVRAEAYPCGVIAAARGSGASSRVTGDIVRSAGAQVRYEFASVAAVAATVPHAGVARALAVASLQVIPDRRISLIEPLARKPGAGGGGGAAGEVVPAGVVRIGATTTGLTGGGVGVAIADTGLDFAHADLDLGTTSGRNFDGFGGNCQDQHGHGTHVGGIVAALKNAIGVVGVAPDATLYCVRVLDANGSGSDSTIMAGLDWVWEQNGGEAASRPPRIGVVNASLGRRGSIGDNPSLRAVFQKLLAQGVTIVVAAGNDASLDVSQQIPAAYPEALAVASTTAGDGQNSCKRYNGFVRRDTASVYTSDGLGVAISAPGNEREDINRGCMLGSTGILSLALGGTTTRMSGTSMAAPHVAGVVAQLLDGDGSITPDCRKIRIQDGAERRDEAPLDSPAGSYSFDGVREGVLSAPGALAASCSN